MQDKNQPYKLTKLARDDLLEIISYIAKDNKSATYEMKDKFLKAFSLISENPNIGHKRENILKSVRFWNVGKYSVIYSVEPKYIKIIRILHGYRDLFEIPN
ncbi:MAG: type II toxin-antitoxin system RelE/ParE family toxin [Rickettsiales bacterium]|nr:type II toxin-antitoxin system RelE/ParE family toxin [Rickettsiales bacterium]